MVAATKKSAPARDVEVGDELYFQHPAGPRWGKVVAHGKHGATIDCDGRRHKVRWDSFLGHKVRVRPDYKVVDQGEDGLVVEGAKGRRKFISDPIFDEIAKANGGIPLLFFSDGDAFKAIKDGPGNSLQPVTDKAGHQTHRWKKTAVEIPKGRERASPEAGSAHGFGTHNLNTGDEVSFEMGALSGRGKIVAMGTSGATVADEKGREHHVHWAEMRSGPHGDAGKSTKKNAELKEKAGRLAAAGKALKMKHSDGRTAHVGPDMSNKDKFRSTRFDPDGASGHTEHDSFEDAIHSTLRDGFEAQHESESQRPIPADKFDAASYAKTHDQADVTPEAILAQFPADTEAKIAAAQDRLKKVEETISIYKKDGTYTPERLAIHDKIVEHFLSREKQEAARPKEGQKPTFTLLGGRGGSGKSSLEGLVYDPSTAIVLDSDEIKKMLPEYEGWNAAQVHEEAGDLFDLMTDYAEANRLNLIHDATMKSTGKAVKLAQRFKDSGYNLEAHYMHLPRQEAAKRAVDRFLGKTGRFVPVDVILANTTNEASFDAVKKLADKWSFYDNNVPRDHAPILISKGGAEDTGKQKDAEKSA